MQVNMHCFKLEYVQLHITGDNKINFTYCFIENLTKKSCNDLNYSTTLPPQVFELVVFSKALINHCPLQFLIKFIMSQIGVKLAGGGEEELEDFSTIILLPLFLKRTNSQVLFPQSSVRKTFRWIQDFALGHFNLRKISRWSWAK